MHPRDILSAVTDNEADKLTELAKDQLVLEMGSHYGFSTVVLGRVAKQVHAVDCHVGDDHAGHGDSLIVFRDNLRRYNLEPWIAVYVGRFEQVLPTFKSAYFDGVFLDGQHDYDSVKRDTELLWRVLKPGGWAAFHDYGAANPLFGVQQCVDEYCKYFRPRLQVERVDNLAVIRKPEKP